MIASRSLGAALTGLRSRCLPVQPHQTCPNPRCREDTHPTQLAPSFPKEVALDAGVRLLLRPTDDTPSTLQTPFLTLLFRTWYFCFCFRSTICRQRYLVDKRGLLGRLC